MSRQRFRDIKKYLHLCNDDILNLSDKIFKVRGFLKKICLKLHQLEILSKCLSIDEEMVPYTGHHMAKMFMHGKPVRFGYKI